MTIFTLKKAKNHLRSFTGQVLAALLLLVVPVGLAADPWPAEGERLYTQEHMARMVAEALADKGGDPDAVAVEFSPALPTLRTAADARPIVVEEVTTDASGRRFAARVAMPIGSGNIHRQTLTGQLHRLAQVPVPTRAIGRGETIQAEDLEWVQLKDSRIGTSVVVEASQLVGHAVRSPLRPGAPVRATQIRKPVAVAKGSLVLLVLERQGMALSARARALEDGGVGETIRVSNLQSSTVVEGTVTGPGRIDVSILGRPQKGGRR
jgi:flagella basal body P-ring formation protein FlgA